MKRRILSFLLLIVIIFSLSGCSASDFTLYFGIDTIPENLDPQKAESYSELLTVKNCFRGLLRLDSNNNPVLDLAESYNVSNDGKIYTFKLKESYWSNGKKITSKDFEFAIKRATLPLTETPTPEIFYSIVGAKERLSGNENAFLGVNAEKEDTLIITLTEADDSFLNKICSAAFLPCSESFFNSSGGKYGLGTKFLLTNGDYKIIAWSENNIRLKLVSEPKNSAVAKTVVLSVSTQGKGAIDRICDNDIGMTVNTYDDYTRVSKNNYIVDVLYRINYSIIFNKNTAVGQNFMLTTALAQSIDISALDSILNDRYIISNGVFSSQAIISSILTENNSKSNILNQYNPEQARTNYLEAIKSLPGKKMPTLNVVTIDDPQIKSVLANVISKWESNLGIYVNIKTVKNEAALLSTMKSGNYTVAFCPIGNNIDESINLFKSGNALDAANDTVYSIIDQYNISNDYKTKLNAFNNICNIVNNDSSIIPIISVPTAYIWHKDYSGVSFNKTDNTLYFVDIYIK